ncbi:MAG: hypothetical protein ACRDRW_21395 [Pseudonocardiaceae bacterium]
MPAYDPVSNPEWPPTGEQLSEALATVDTALTALRRAARRDTVTTRALLILFAITPLPWVALIDAPRSVLLDHQPVTRAGRCHACRRFEHPAERGRHRRADTRRRPAAPPAG